MIAAPGVSNYCQSVLDLVNLKDGKIHDDGFEYGWVEGHLRYLY